MIIEIQSVLEDKRIQLSVEFCQSQGDTKILVNDWEDFISLQEWFESEASIIDATDLELKHYLNWQEQNMNALLAA